MHYVMGRLWAASPARRPDRASYNDQGLWWNDGVRFDQRVITPLRVSLLPYNPVSPDQSLELPSFIDGDVPLFRDDLIEALRDAGVSNLDLYDSELYDPDTGVALAHFKAVNIIGMVAAADMRKSDATVHDGIPAIDVSFDRLVIDEDKAGGLLMFRLLENNNAIVVAEQVRSAVLRRGLKDIQFFKPENIAL